MEASDVELVAVERVGRTFKSLLVSINDVKGPENQHRPSIYIVPSVFRDLSPSSFNPRVVSIGPLHREVENLQGFEDQKLTYLDDLLTRLDSKKESRHAILEECVQRVSDSIDQIKPCYPGMKSWPEDDELVRMMVIDACFILEFIFHLSESHGPLRKNMLITQPIIYDLLMIENQIPFFVLQCIFKCTILKFKPRASLTKHIKILLNRYHVFGAKLVVSNVSSVSPPDHILGLLHKSYQPVDVIPSDFISIPKGHSAMELDRAGVNFKPNQDNNWAMAMEVKLPRISCFPWFCCKPTLSMPIVHIHDFTELILRNLIAYEHCFLAQNCVTAYACAMDMLIDTPEDVAKLVKSEVLINSLGSNENVANMINNICKELPIVDFFYYQDWKKMDAYYNGCLPNLAAELKRKYFSSPWNIIALFAAFVLFALTIVQTIFSIKSA